MRISKKTLIRKLLKESGGMTVAEIAKHSGYSSKEAARTALLTMPDVYIDRWDVRVKRWAAIWCVVDVPPHCPRPNKRTKEKTHD